MRHNCLEIFENVPVGVSELKSVYSNYAAVRNKICSLEQDNQLIRLRKGLYVVSPDISNQLLSMGLIANHIYAPSYVSMQTALRYYGIIPEAVYNYQSMTLKPSKYFTNSLGRFDYYCAPCDYYSVGITQGEFENKFFLIATPEKALCDLICYTPNLNIRSFKSFKLFLQEDLRVDWTLLMHFDTEIIKKCMSVGKKKHILNYLIKILES